MDNPSNINKIKIKMPTGKNNYKLLLSFNFDQNMCSNMSKAHITKFRNENMFIDFFF